MHDCDRDVSVLLVSHKSKVWGIQRRLLVLAPRLAERGVRLTLAAPPAGRWAEMWQATGLPIVPLELPAHAGLRRRDGNDRASWLQMGREVAVVAESARRIAKLARAHDVVLSGSLTAHLEVAIAGRLAGRPAILMLVDIVSAGLGRRVLHAAARTAAATVVNSRATQATVAGAGRVHLIHPGIDIDVYQPGSPDPEVRSGLGWRDGEVLVGIVGRIDQEKGIHDLVDAVYHLRGRGLPVRLAIVGDVGTGPATYFEWLREYAIERLDDAVTFAGRRDDVAAVMRALDVVVNASAEEPFGMSVLEAQASGRPVVATAAGGVTDFVIDGENGLLVEPGDITGLARALRRLIEDESLRNRLAANGRLVAVRDFNLADQAPRYEELFRQAFASRPRRR